MSGQRVNPFLGKAKASGDGDFKTEIPSADVHDGRVVAMIDLGSHMESFQGGTPERKRKCLIVFELDEEMTGMKGVNHLIGVQYTLSFHEKAKLRQLVEAVVNDGKPYKNDTDVNLLSLLGQPCVVQIAHDAGKGEKADRTYARVKQVSAVAKKKHATHFTPKRKPVAWFVGDERDDLPDWLPRIYGEKAEDVIGRCLELAEGGKEEDAEAVGAAAEETPF